MAMTAEQLEAVEEFVAALSQHFKNSVLNLPPNNVAGLTGWTPEQMIETYEISIQATLAWARGVAP